MEGLARGIKITDHTEISGTWPCARPFREPLPPLIDMEPPAKKRRFRIALSFAGGENRSFVKKVARLLAARFGEDAVLFDEFHRAEFANPDLAIDLPGLYKNESDLVVAVFCPNYKNKKWCRLEWRAVYSIIVHGGAKRILLSRFGSVEEEGLLGLEGSIDLDQMSAGEFFNVILERLGWNEGRSKNYYVENGSVRRKITTKWRTQDNPFQTGGALRQDHPTYVPRLADEELENLLCGDDRLISITGEFGIGKSSLMQQARRLLPNHQFFGSGLADMGGHDAGRFMRNFFRLFSRRFGAIADWNDLDEYVERCPSIILLDDLAEVAGPGLFALVPGLIDRLCRPGYGLRAIATSPHHVRTIFEKWGLENPRYSRPWKTIHVLPCAEEETDNLFKLLPPRSAKAVKNSLTEITHISNLAPQRLQCLCRRLFDGECNGLSSQQLSALIENHASYE